MILDALKNTNSVIVDSVNAANNKREAQNFKKQLESLSIFTKQLEQLLNLMQLIREKEIATGIITSELKVTLQEAVDSCGEKTKSRSLDSGTVLALKNAVDLCRNALDSAWKDEAEKRCTPVIDSLSSLRGLLDDKKEADDLLNYLGKVKLQVPQSVKALDAFLDNVDRGKKIIEGLHFTSDAEVKAFIEKVRTQRATVKDLSQHIIDWLSDNHLNDKIKLRF